MRTQLNHEPKKSGALALKGCYELPKSMIHQKQQSLRIVLRVA